MKIVTADQMRRMEQDCARTGLSTDTLMENAGRAVAEEIRRGHGNLARQRVLALVGPGNNGGDGLVTARYLHDWGAGVSVYLCAPRPEGDPNLKLAQQSGITCVDAAKDGKQARLGELLALANDVIDALFGTGKIRPLTGILHKVLERVAAAKTERPSLHIIAVDLPSGLNADTGAVDDACLYADDTITLGFPKPGLFRFPGAERVGRLSVVDIGIPAQMAESVTTELITSEWAKSVLPRRPLGGNKGSFGRVLVVAGSANYVGAAYLACSGAIRAGAGLVTLATAASLQPVLAARLAEATYLSLPESQPGVVSAKAAAALIQEQLGKYQVLLLGCGLGQAEPTVALVRAVLFRPGRRLPSLVVDADGLNILAGSAQWWQQLPEAAIVTPHPGEMARLAAMPVADVESDRVGVARNLAAAWHKTVVLKGAFTVIAASDGRVSLSPFANPGLATAGTGDVLAGVIAGLLAQGLPPFDAATLGVYLHGAAGDAVRSDLGDAGMAASDLLPALPRVVRRLKERTLE